MAIQVAINSKIIYIRNKAVPLLLYYKKIFNAKNAAAMLHHKLF